MKRLLSAILLCAAVGASAMPMYRIWRLVKEPGKPDLSLTELENGSVRFAIEGVTGLSSTVDVTKQEAAELGRALLEAAGETKPYSNRCWDELAKASDKIRECDNAEFQRALDGFTRIK